MTKNENKRTRKQYENHADFRAMIDEFLESGWQVAEILNTDAYSTVGSACNSINQTIKSQARHSQAKAVVRNKHVYLVKLTDPEVREVLNIRG